MISNKNTNTLREPQTVYELEAECALTEFEPSGPWGALHARQVELATLMSAGAPSWQTYNKWEAELDLVCGELAAMGC